MNELARSDREIAAQINAVKRQTAQVCLAAAVEIGRLLCEAKSTVPYGDWGKWLEENVNYSQSTANNLMRLYQNYGEQEQISFLEENSLEIFGSLSPSQALALLGMPKEERVNYVESHDMETVSVRDIEEEIAARKEAEEKAETAEREKEAAVSDAENARRLAKNAQEQLEREREAMRRELEEAKKAVADAGQVAITATVEPDEEAMRALRESYEKKLEQKEKALKKAQEAAEKAAAGQEEAAEKAKKEAEAALREDMEKLKREKSEVEAKLTTAGAATVQRYGVYFENLQRDFDKLIELGKDIRKQEPETADKLDRALHSVIERMAKRVREEEQP